MADRSPVPGVNPDTKPPSNWCMCPVAPAPHQATVACETAPALPLHRDTQYTSSFEGGPTVVEASVAKTDQYPGDRQRLVGDITTGGKRDVAKGGRGNSKQIAGGSTKGRPGGPVSQTQRVPYQRRSTVPQGPSGHPNPAATQSAPNVRSRGQQSGR